MEWEEVFRSISGSYTDMPQAAWKEKRGCPEGEFVHPIYRLQLEDDVRAELAYTLVKEHAERYIDRDPDRNDLYEDDDFLIFRKRDAPKKADTSRDHVFIVHRDGTIISRLIAQHVYSGEGSLPLSEELFERETARHIDRFRTDIMDTLLGDIEPFVELYAYLQDAEQIGLLEENLAWIEEHGPPPNLDYLRSRKHRDPADFQLEPGTKGEEERQFAATSVWEAGFETVKKLLSEA